MTYALQTGGGISLRPRPYRTFALFFLLFALASGVRAQLTVQLDNLSLTGNPGSTLTFTGTLRNLGPTDLYLNGFDFDFGGAGPYLFGDVAASVPLGLSSSSTAGQIFPSATYTGDLFVVQIAPTAPAGVYPVGVRITGGANEQSSDLLAQVFFQTEVSSELPEPGTFALLVIGATALTLRRRA